MNESISLSGLARQLAMAGLMDEKAAQQAQQQAQRNKLPLVTYLVQNKLVKSRALAELGRRTVWRGLLRPQFHRQGRATA